MLFGAALWVPSLAPYLSYSDEIHEAQSKIYDIIYIIMGFSMMSGGIVVNPFSTNVPLMDKPGDWFLLAKCLKNTCGRVIF